MRWLLTKSSLGALAGALVLCLTVGAQTGYGAGMLVADGGLGGALEIKEHDVHVTINNGVAVTEVEQVFVNTEDRVVEALYTFPVPKNASVSNFSMWIGGKEMIGEVVEKPAGSRDLRELQTRAARSRPARTGGLQAVRDADLSDSGPGRATGARDVLPRARFRS